MTEAVLNFLTTKVKWWNVWATMIVSLFVMWLLPDVFWKVWICIFVSDFVYFIADEHYKK
jgi:uncharacterized membrane protein